MPDDFKVTYSLESALMGYKANIQITKENIVLNYRNKNTGLKDSSSYRIRSSESDSIFSFIRKADIVSLRVDNSTQVLDTPIQNITVRYDGKTNSIDYGKAKEFPEKLMTLQSMIYSLASKYDSKWESVIRK